MKKFLTIFMALMLTGCSTNKNETSDREFKVGYNIFPMSFSDSNNDGVGDINGITEKLDYLVDLGVDTIWLNPIHPSNSYHKYDVIDYYEVDNEFGNMEDFEKLIEEAHKRDINVIMDLVVNHTSTEHPWFQDAISSEDSEYRDYYRFYDFNDGLATYGTKDGWAQLEDGTYYFASFWSGMPELNFENEKVTEEIYKIADFWIEKGVDGFRIDAVKHVFDQREYPKGTITQKLNFEWFEEFKLYVESIKPDIFVIGEVYADYQTVTPFYQGLDVLFNFTVAENIITTVYSGINTDFNSVVEKSIKGMDKYNENGVQAYFISNHDQDRVMSRLKGDVEKAKLASNIMLTLPGMSWIYYGEEIGMFGEGHDEQKREPINWGDEFTTSWEEVIYNKEIAPVSEQDENSLYYTYKELIKLKKDNDVLLYGNFEGIDTEKNQLSYKIYDDNRSLIIVHNLSSESLNLEYDLSVLYSNGYENNVLQPYKTVIFENTVE